MRPMAFLAAVLCTALTLSRPVAAAGWDEDIAFGDILGEQRTVEIGRTDTFVGLALAHGVGYVELRAANPDIDPWLPPAGEDLLLPTRKIAPRAEGAGIVVNRAEMRLYLYRDDMPVWTAPISLGRDGYQTPLGRLPIGQKNKNPNWYPTQSHREETPELPRVVASGPDNPLGDYALRLGHTAYLLHGTNRPMSIGRQVSRGCIRLYPQDIERLFEQVSLGMDVRIIDAPVKVAFHEGRLYLEIAPSIDQVHAFDLGGEVPVDPYREIRSLLLEVVGDLASEIDWSKVERLARERRGLPEPVSAPIARELGSSVPTSASSG